MNCIISCFYLYSFCLLLKYGIVFNGKLSLTQILLKPWHFNYNKKCKAGTFSSMVWSYDFVIVPELKLLALNLNVSCSVHYNWSISFVIVGVLVCSFACIWIDVILWIEVFFFKPLVDSCLILDCMKGKLQLIRSFTS